MSIVPHDDALPLTKLCTKCNEYKHLDDYYVKIKATGRLMSWCKPCHNAMTIATFKKKYAADPEPFKKASREYAAANPEKCRATQKAYLQANAEVVKAKARAYNASPEGQAKKAAYRLANAERRRAYNRLYRQLNREAIYEADRLYRAANPQKYRDAARRWQAANPEATRVIKSKGHARRRSLMATIEGSFTTAEWLALKERYGNRCLCCGKPESEAPLTIDHVRPISRGGRNDISNLQPICGSCNSSKNCRHIDYRPD